MKSLLIKAICPLIIALTSFSCIVEADSGPDRYGYCDEFLFLYLVAPRNSTAEVISLVLLAACLADDEY